MRNRRYNYQPQMVDPGVIDFGSIQMYNPEDTARLAQVGQGMQQRWDASQSAFAKQLEDIGAADINPRYKQEIIDTLQADVDNIHQTVNKDYQGDYGRAYNDVIKSLSKSRGLLHAATQATAAEKQARAEFQNLQVQGKAPHIYDSNLGTRRQMSFEEYHKMLGEDNRTVKSPFDEEGKFTGYQFNPLRGASDITGYLERNISKSLSEIMTSGKLTPAGHGYLSYEDIRGLDDTEITNLYNQEGAKKALGKQIRNEVDFAGEEFRDATDEQIAEYAIPIIKNQVSQQRQKKYEYDRLAAEERKKKALAGLTDTPLPGNPELIEGAGINLPLGKQGINPKDVLTRAKSGDEESGELVNKGLNKIKTANPDKYLFFKPSKTGVASDIPQISTFFKQEMTEVFNDPVFSWLRGEKEIKEYKSKLSKYSLPEKLVENYIETGDIKAYRQIIDGYQKHFYGEELDPRGGKKKDSFSAPGVQQLRITLKTLRQERKELEKDITTYFNEDVESGARVGILQPRMGSTFGEGLVKYFEPGGGFDMLQDFTPGFSDRKTSQGDKFGVLGKDMAERFKHESSNGQVYYAPSSVRIERASANKPTRIIAYDNAGEPVTLDLVKTKKNKDAILKNISFESGVPGIYQGEMVYNLAQELKSKGEVTKRVRTKDGILPLTLTYSDGEYKINGQIIQPSDDIPDYKENAMLTYLKYTGELDAYGAEFNAYRANKFSSNTDNKKAALQLLYGAYYNDDSEE